MKVFEGNGMIVVKYDWREKRAKQREFDALRRELRYEARARIASWHSKRARGFSR